ncbi:hypothetical protein MtrunA17_Chr7g0225481 [Medicago truncatula]|uniref:Uncharacterized protein n=1 Tax=Medicago truncatula TaxID=3880 RepID=A0A396GV35_MEDTR|nr:hypothetical protein MtrunA17_Chr7g0225481 [Medicago truncatula]
MTFVYSRRINYHWDLLHNYVHQTMGFLKRKMGSNMKRVQMKWMEAIRRQMVVVEIKRSINKQLRVELVEQQVENSIILVKIRNHLRTNN